MQISIKNRWDNKVILCGEYESVKDCLERNRDANLRDANLRDADLRGAYLGCAYLGGADLRYAYLRDAYLGCANLRDAKNYSHSHDFWIEIIRRQKLETFTEKEWAIIGQVYVHRLCWESIKKRYGKKIMPIFKKLTKLNFGEWEEKYEKILKEIRL